MQSGGARTATAVIVITMIFGPVAKDNGWAYKLVGKKQTTQMMQCTPGAACPATKTVTKKVYLPKPAAKKPPVAKAPAKKAPVKVNVVVAKPTKKKTAPKPK